MGCHRQLGQPGEALATCRGGREYYPDDTELVFLEGLLHRERSDLAAAEACLTRLLRTKPGEHFASVDTALRGYKARHNLAVVYHLQGRAAEAEEQWRTALDERPDFTPAWLGMGELGLAQGRWDEVERAAEKLKGEPAEAAVLRARGHLARKEFADARQLLEAAIGEVPQSLGPRVVLSHVLLQEGQDWVAAEKALHDVLALDAEHTEAKRNLAVLLGRQSRLVDEVFVTDTTPA